MGAFPSGSPRLVCSLAHSRDKLTCSVDRKAIASSLVLVFPSKMFCSPQSHPKSPILGCRLVRYDPYGTSTSISILAISVKMLYFPQSYQNSRIVGCTLVRYDSQFSLPRFPFWQFRPKSCIFPNPTRIRQANGTYRLLG